MRDATLTDRARTMRREATPPERALWRILRAPPFAALHFRRQVAFETRYIADFASHRGRIVVEADGQSHDFTEAADAARTAWFEGRGYRVVRVRNRDIMDPAVDVARWLAAELGVVFE